MTPRGHNPTPPPLAYLREARRLRARFGDQPSLLQSHLRQLALTRNSELSHPSPPSPARITPAQVTPARVTPSPFRNPQSAIRNPQSPPSALRHPTSDIPHPTSPPTPPPSLLSVPPAVSNAFAAEIEAHLTDGAGLLRYTARKRLLARAAHLRISPFDANLLIASVLHAHRTSPHPLPPPHPSAPTHTDLHLSHLLYSLLTATALAALAWLALV